MKVDPAPILQPGMKMDVVIIVMAATRKNSTRIRHWNRERPNTVEVPVSGFEISMAIFSNS